MIKKVSKILSIYFIIGFINACYCPPIDFPYFDFEAINISTDLPNPNYHEGGFAFTITFDSIGFVAQNNISFISNAFALSCEENGDLGPKYPISEINVFSDSIFDSSIPSGEKLNELFQVSISYSNFTPLDQIDYKDYPKPHYRSEIKLTSQSIPVDLNKDYTFTIEIIKNNNDIVKSETGPIKWSN